MNALRGQQKHLEEPCWEYHKAAVNMELHDAKAWWMQWQTHCHMEMDEECERVLAKPPATFENVGLVDYSLVQLINSRWDTRESVAKTEREEVSTVTAQNQLHYLPPKKFEYHVVDSMGRPYVAQHGRLEDFRAPWEAHQLADDGAMNQG